GAVIDPGLYVAGQIAVTSFQLMTHYANDYFDFESDRLNTTATSWSGGSRVLPAGEVLRPTALAAGVGRAGGGPGARRIGRRERAGGLGGAGVLLPDGGGGGGVHPPAVAPAFDWPRRARCCAGRDDAGPLHGLLPAGAGAGRFAPVASRGGAAWLSTDSHA